MVVKKRNQVDVTYAKNALFLKERYDLIPEDFKVDLQMENLEQWRKVKNLINDESFKLKTEYEEYDLVKLNSVLTPYKNENSPFIDAFVEESEWFNILNKSFELTDEIDYLDEVVDWGVSIQNFLLWIKVQLNDFFDQDINQLKYKDIVIKNLLENIASDLVSSILKSAVLELQIAKLEGKLSGETPEERFQSFIKIQFANKENALAFYSEYIVLARLLTIKSLYFVNNIKESYSSFLKDKVVLIDDMGIDGPLLSITPGLGDKHQKGNTVIEYKFLNKSVFYKPKNLGVASSYNQLIDWINGKNELLKMKTYNFLDRDSYSWEDKVVKKDCETEQEVENFYEKFGQLIAIMHCLRGGDFHLENIIASGENPIVIDLETLFQQPIPTTFPDRAEVIAKLDTLESVINTLLLPNRIYQDFNDTKGIDMSGLSGSEQEYPVPILAPLNHNSDEMIFKQQEQLVLTSDNYNLPVYEGKYVDFRNYKHLIYRGFKKASEFFMVHREELINHPSLLKNFKTKPVRVILRPTQKYAQMLLESLHPDYLRDGLSRDQIFENMWGYSFVNKTVASHEVNEMLVGDVPIFFNLPESRDIFDGNNRIIKDFFKTSSYDLVVNRLNELNDKEIQKQLSWIKVSLKDTSDESSYSYLNYSALVNETDLTNERLIKEASEIGYRILNDAYYSDDSSSISWLGLVPGKNNELGIDPLPVDFYDGLSGVALLYYQLHKATKDEVFKKAYEQLLHTLNQDEKIYNKVSPSIGSVSVLQMVSKISETNEVIDELLYKHTNFVEENIHLIEENDFLTGFAGLVNTFLHLYDAKEDKRFLKVAISLGEKLIETLKGEGIDKVKGGMSHGASGISYALFKLYSFDKNDSFYHFAKICLEKDQQFFDNSKKAWIDEKNRYTHQWCHGSTGIGLSRILVKDYIENEFLFKEIDIAYNNILNQGYKTDDCLCHGNMGDIDFFLALDTEDSKKSSIKLIQQVLLSKEENKDYYIKNSTPGFEKIGLFTGLAGIAYQFLRVANPEIPSVLH